MADYKKSNFFKTPYSATAVTIMTRKFALSPEDTSRPVVANDDQGGQLPHIRPPSRHAPFYNRNLGEESILTESLNLHPEA